MQSMYVLRMYFLKRIFSIKCTLDGSASENIPPIVYTQQVMYQMSKLSTPIQKP